MLRRVYGMSMGDGIRKLLGLGSRQKDAGEAAAPCATAERYHERRAHPRILTRERVRIYLTNHPLSAVLLDISKGGVRISTKHPREINSEIFIELEFEDRRAHLPVRILWDRFVDGSFESGGRFEGLNEQERLHLNGYLQFVTSQAHA
jgi:hypothetical protein